MSGGTPTWERVKRLDAAAAVAEVNERTGAGLRYEGPAPGGNVGAGYVRWPDGRASVLTWRPAGQVAHEELVADILGVARRHGLPVPAYELITEITGAVVIVQERLPGSVTHPVDAPAVAAMIDVNRRCRGVLASRSDIPAPELYLTGDGPGFCLHEPLARHNRRSARLLGWVRDVGASAPARLAGDDLVHCDFQPMNVLRDAAGVVTGIVDWDAASRGDARFDLVVLRFGLHGVSGDVATRDLLAGPVDELLAEVLRPEELRWYWAHMSLRMVDWAIRHFTAADVDDWLTFAERRAYD